MPRPDTDPKWIKGKVDRLAIDEGCYFDQEQADWAVEFIERFCTLTKGKSAGKKISLSPWQLDFVSRLFGWRRADGTRRYRTAYVEIPKKNGKSLVLSAIAVYMAIADGEPGAEVYLAAVNSKQARIIFDECVKMIRCNKSLSKRMLIQDTAKTIKIPSTFSKIQLVTSDADSQDGFDSSCTIFDELHRQKNSKLWEVFEYAGRGRDQPLLLSITTAGQDRSSVCWQEHERSRKVESGEVLDTTHLAIIYAANRSDPLDDEATWFKANPSLGHTLRLDDFKRDLDKVRESPSGLNNFKRLRLNIWTEPTTAFIAYDHWIKCGKVPFDPKSLEGQICYGGLDMSTKKDITSFVLLFGDQDKGFTVLPFFWIPEVEAKERERNHDIPYTDWSNKHLVTLTPGAAIDYELIINRIVELSKTYRIKGVYSDEWGSSEAVAQAISKRGVKVQFMHQGFRMSEPTKELERQAILGKLNHGNNEILTWMNQNAEVKSDSNGNICLVKPSPDSPKKIDGLIGMVEALHGEMRSRKKSVYSTRTVEELLGENPNPNPT